VARFAVGAIVAAALAWSLAGCGDDGPASFVGKASNSVVYVSWTRSGDSLSGQLTQARRPDQTDGTVDTSRASFDGTVDGSAVSLQINQGFGSVSTLTGKLDGDDLALDFPGADGGIVTIRLRDGDSGDFNAALADLRGQAEQDKADADAAAAEQQALQDAANTADAVRAGIDALAQAAENVTASNPGLLQSDLDTVRSSLDQVRSDYDLLVGDQEAGYGTECEDAAAVGEDVDAMRADIAAMRADVKSNADTSVLDADISDLRSRLADLEAVDPTMLPADAPTQADVDGAIQAAKRTVRQRAARGADFSAAGKLLAQGEAIQAKADAACG
jgi:predicted small lipoprotein YifL